MGGGNEGVVGRGFQKGLIQGLRSLILGVHSMFLRGGALLRFR